MPVSQPEYVKWVTSRRRVVCRGCALHPSRRAQREAAESSQRVFQRELSGSGYGEITTEIAPLDRFYFAEAYHQQYLVKNPSGYCGLGGTGVSCPVGIGAAALRE